MSGVTGKVYPCHRAPVRTASVKEEGSPHSHAAVARQVVGQAKAHPQQLGHVT